MVTHVKSFSFSPCSTRERISMMKIPAYWREIRGHWLFGFLLGSDIDKFYYLFVTFDIAFS